MSQKFRIGYKNIWRDGLVIARTTEHPQFPAENTQDDDKALHWRSTAIAAAQVIDLDAGAPYGYNLVCLLNHNIQGGATITFYGADDAAFTSNVVSDTLTYYGNNLFKFLSVLRRARYLRISVTDTTNPSGYIKIGSVLVYEYIELARYPKPSGYSKGEDNPSLVDLSDSQNLYADDKPRLFKRSYPFDGLSNTDASNIILMMEECGDHKGIVVCTDPDNPNTASEFVTLAELNEVQYSHPNYWNWTMNVREHK